MGTGESDDPERVIDSLARSGVIEGTGEKKVQFTEEFATVIEEQRSFLSSADESAITERLDPVTGEETVTEAILDVGAESDRIVAEYLALADCDGLAHADRLRALTVFDQFYSSPPPARGSPDAFLPVRGDRLPLLFEVYDRAIVYIWREDCRPCDAVRNDLDEIFSDQPDDLGLFSVFGPDWAAPLQEKYDVTGGPTTLFIEDGRIDYRVYSAPPPSHLFRECRRYTDALDDASIP